MGTVHFDELSWTEAKTNQSERESTRALFKTSAGVLTDEAWISFLLAASNSSRSFDENEM